MQECSNLFADFGVDADAGVLRPQASSPLTTHKPDVSILSAGGLP
jgi:hypothetical protein